MPDPFIKIEVNLTADIVMLGLGKKRYEASVKQGGSQLQLLLEVKEFDSIICNADYKDDEKYKYLNQKEFENLVAFIHEFTGDADSADALDFMKIGYRRNIGEVVSIKNYVGLIQMKNGFQIQVLPKISFGEEDEGNV